MIKAIITDLDGTFLNSSGIATEENIDYVIKAHEMGIKVVFASGRGPDSISRIVKSFSDMIFPIIGCSGAIVSLGNNVLYHETINSSIAEELVLWAIENKLHIQSFWGDKRVIHEACVSFPFHQMTCGMHYELSNNLDKIVSENPPLKLMITDSAERILKIRKTITPRYPQLKLTMSGENYLDIIPGNCSKGAGLKVICKAFDISPEETVAFGNDENDLEMIEIAGIGVAMENSPDKLINVADIIAPSNDDSGFAIVLNDIVNKRK